MKYERTFMIAPALVRLIQRERLVGRDIIEGYPVPNTGARSLCPDRAGWVHRSAYRQCDGYADGGPREGLCGTGQGAC